MSDLVSDYEFDLPPELIASRPLARRDDSRMLVLHRESGKIEHRMFRDFACYLNPADRVVLNNSLVLKARLFSDDGRIEVLLLEPSGDRTWKCLVKPGRKMRAGTTIPIAGTTGTVRDVSPTGERFIVFADEPDLEKYGSMPIPPYFERNADAEDNERYQTVFAKTPGSVAAPTAGLHFTPELLDKIPHATITLHVGIGTFQPVKADRVADHQMHEERYSITPETARLLNSAGRLVAIGTTSTRVLESQPPGPFHACEGATAIFIHPPYSFKRVGALLTNFHLPRSSLLMLVSAFAGREHVLAAYAEAVRERYRFFSYGDCMLLV